MRRSTLNTKYKNINLVDVHLADDGVVQATGSGDVVMTMKTPSGVKKGVFTNVWHVPKLTRNLFSVGRLTKDECRASDIRRERLLRGH